MKYAIHVVAVLALLTAAGCNPKRVEVKLTPVEGYFSSIKTSQLSVLILNKEQFNSHFHYAATMGKLPTKIDFDSQFVGAIVLPETWYDETISISNAYIIHDTLHIEYSVTKGDEERTFSIIPCLLFAFSNELDADTISFDNGPLSTKVSYHPKPMVIFSSDQD